MHAAKAQLALQQHSASPAAKLNLVSFAGKSQPESTPAGARMPAGQPRKWLRIDEQGKSAYIKVQKGDQLISKHNFLIPSLTTQARVFYTGGKAPASWILKHSVPRLAYFGPTGTL